MKTIETRSLLFEIHITTNDIDQANIEDFITFCQQIDAKPILIELSSGTYFRQPMISKIISCSTKIALENIVNKLRLAFIAKNYLPTRIKIEVPAWNYKDVQGFYEGESYFEWHGKIKMESEQSIKTICLKNDAHLSRNSLRGSSHSKFLTVREFSNFETFSNRIHKLKQDLTQHQIDLLKDESEYCIFDSNKSLDTGWIT
jgi:hypothetical protein